MSASVALTIDAELCSRLTLTLAHFLWQGTVIGLLAALTASMFRNSPTSKYRIYAVALLLMAACPPATFRLLAPPPAIVAVFVGRPSAPTISASRTVPSLSPASPAAVPSGDLSLKPALISASSPPALPASPPAFVWQRRASQIAATYLAGVGVMLARVLLGLCGAHRLCRRSEAITDPAVVAVVARLARRFAMAVAPSLRQCGDVLVPTVAGVIRPVILLPIAVLAGLEPEQLEAIIAHELAHIRRRDPLVLLLQRLVEAALFFHPAVWLVSRALHVQREHCCDDAVVRSLGRPVTYAQSLVRVAELCLAQRAGTLAGVTLAAVDDHSALHRRIARLLDGGRSPRVRLSRGGLLTVVIAATLLGLVAMHWRGPIAAAVETAAPHTGRLLDVAGRPVSNAYIAVDDQNLWTAVRSDVAGAFTLGVLPPTAHQLIVWSQRSRRMGLATIAASSAKQLPPVKLDYAEANADGRVVDASGNPVKGAWVRLFISEPDGSTFRCRTYRATDSSGYYTAGLIPAGPGLMLHATLSDDPTDKNATAALSLAQQYQVELPDLVVRSTTAPSAKPGMPRVKYSGRVVDETGASVPGAEIELEYPKNHMIAGAGVVLSDADGRFSRLLPPDADGVEIRVTCAGFIQPERAVTPATSALRDGSALIELRHGLPLEGVVRDDTGQPVSNALVLGDKARARTPGPMSEPIENAWTPRTGRDGSFRVEGLPPGSRQVTVLADGFAPALISVNVKTGSPKLEVRLERGLTYSARVVDPDGKPIPGVNVGCDDWAVGSKHFDALVRFAKSDDEGRFTLRALPREGTVAIMFGQSRLGFLSNEISWSATGRNADAIRLYKAAVITGVVRDADTDKPITRFQVRPGIYWKEGDAFDESTFDGPVDVAAEDGRFSSVVQRIGLGSSETLPTFAAKIIADGYAAQVTPKVYLGKAYEPFVIRMRKAQPIKGVVSDPKGKPVEGATIFYVEPTDTLQVHGLNVGEDVARAPTLRTKTDANGAFAISASTEGVRLLALHPAGYALVPGSSAAQITLTPWARVQGDLISKGNAYNGVTLILQSRGPREKTSSPAEAYFELKTVTRADGKFEFGYVPSTPLELLVYSQGAASTNVDVDAKPGETVELHLGK